VQPVPYDILEAMVQCFGKCFHYKDPMEAFLVSAGMPKALAAKHKHEAKYVWARNLLTELAESEDGAVKQRRILTALCNLRDLPEKEVKDRNAGLDALRGLKRLALSKHLVAKKERDAGKAARELHEQRARQAAERSKKVEALRDRFNGAVTSSDRQKAGYALEDILKELFAVFEIEYRKSYKTDTQQIDGAFRFSGFDYLVEAKWRKEQPTEADIMGFRGKVEGKLESTRGIFVSVPGFRPEVARKFNGRSNLVLLDGEHLVMVLEGRLSLPDLLEKVIARAAHEGVAHTPARTLGVYGRGLSK